MNWATAGFDGPESFEAWYDSLCDRHPRRGHEKLGKDYLLHLFISKKVETHRGKPMREWLELCHAAYCQTKDWLGGYSPSIFNWLQQETWKRYPQGAVEPPQQYHCQQCGDTGKVVVGETGADCREEICGCRRAA